MDNERPTPPPAQQALPFDDEAGLPVPYALTARARLEVAPDAVPDLEVVPSVPAGDDRSDATRTTAARARSTGTAVARRSPPAGSRGGPSSSRHPTGRPVEDDGALDEPADTRPSRARALRRAGVGVPQIARQLGVEELTVRAWVGDLGGAPTVDHPAGGLVALPGLPAAGGGADPAGRRRERAREEGRLRLRQDPRFAAGLGLLVGAGEVDAHGVGLRTHDPRVAAAVIDWLTEYGGVRPERIRVVLRLGAKVAGDLARHTWSGELRLPLEQLTHTRWRGAPDPQAVEALLHVTDERLAARLTGWTQALLEPEPTPLDAAF
jgi:hypothetical protein